MKHEFKVTKSKDQTVYTLESATGGSSSTAGGATVSTPLGGVRKRGDNLLAQEADKNKVPATTPRNFVAKNAKTGGAGAHKDKKKAEKQGNVKHKKPFAEEGVAEGKVGADPYDRGYHDGQRMGSNSYHNPYSREDEPTEWDEYKSGFNMAQIELQNDLEDNGFSEGVAEGFNGEYDDEAGMAHSNLLTTARAVMGLLKTIKDRDNLPEWGQEKIAKAEMMLVSVWDYLQSQKELGNDPQVDTEEGAGRPFRGVGGAFNRGDDERHDLDPTDWYVVKDGKMFAVSVYPNQEREATARGYSRTRAEAKAKASEQGVAEGLSKRDQQDVAAIRAAIERLQTQLSHPNADKDAIQQSIAHERNRLALYGVAEGKDEKIAQLKKDHETAVHWSKNETSPQKREAARQKAEKIKRHLDTQYKQGVAEGSGDLTDIWQAGKEAAYMKKPMSACPYKMFSREWEAWQQGWQDQQRSKSWDDSVYEQGVAEDDAGDIEQRMIAKIAKYKEHLAHLKKTDPEAYKREMEKRKTSSRIPPVSTFEGQGVAEADKKGLYYYVNKRKKAGTSRDADSPKAPTAQAWKDAAKTAKKEGADTYFESLVNKLDELKKKK